jgi:hypothetical protein
MNYLQQQQEHADHVFGAQYDDVRERYASEIKDLEMYAKSEEEHYEYLGKVYEAGFGDDCEAYEEYWKRTMERAETEEVIIND